MLGEIGQALTMDDLELFERRGDVGLLLLQFLDKGVGALSDESNL